MGLGPLDLSRSNEMPLVLDFPNTVTLSRYGRRLLSHEARDSQ